MLLVIAVELVLIIFVLVIYNPFLKFDLVGKEYIEIAVGTNYIDKGIEVSYFNEDLTNKVYTFSNLNVNKVGTYEYEYTLSKGIYRRNLKRTVKVIDAVAPTLTLTGEEKVNLCGKEYLEYGYKAIDNVDGDITSRVVLVKYNDKIIYKVKDATGNEATATRYLIKNDQKIPEIILNGSNLITIKKGTKYEELGAVSVDNCDGDISKNIEINSEFDSNIAGTYQVSYSVSDSAQNENLINRTIIVYEDNDLNKGYEEILVGPTYIKGILLVNKKYSIPVDFKEDDKLALESLERLQTDALEAGHQLPLISSYRSYKDQTKTYNNYLKSSGQVYADGRAARPGHSEHQTGLAFDIGQGKISFGETSAGKWLEENCYKYGFIIRYPKYKEAITGYNYEPWHIRYVGQKVATEIMQKNLTLEEYLGVYK